MDATYSKDYQAGILGDDFHHVTLPDEVAEDQKYYDGMEITVIDHMGDEVPAILRGDLYGLHTPGTGDPVVELIEEAR